MKTIPASRVSRRNAAPPRPERDFVLYWMTASRRLRWNFGLQHAVAQAEALGKPLFILEALRAGYPWASERLHRFVLDGMAEHAARLHGGPVGYHAYVEPSPGEGRGLLEALAGRAALVVTDHYPCFFLPKMVEAAAARLDVALDAVDSNGLLPLSVTPGDFPTAHAFRRFLQKNLRPHLALRPLAEPLADLDLPPAPPLPEAITRRWPALSAEGLRGLDLGALPVDHAVAPVALRGGGQAAGERLARFVGARLSRYGEDRNRPEQDGSSGLSPYLHFGHLSAHEAAWAVLASERWTPDRLSTSTAGSREGWWGLSPAAEGFLDELVTWRELGFVFCQHRPDYADFRSLPPWALDTLERHRADPRERLYDLAALDAGRTYDPLWNAAQNQLRRSGVMHNYLRMLWGKKILEWSPSPELALEAMIQLNNRYALDGRDPNSYSGIFWVLGRFDRAWGPERPVYGTVRYMSSDNTARKFPVKGYIETWTRTRPGELLGPARR